MRVEFELTFRDLLIFNITHQIRSVTVHLFLTLGPLLILFFAEGGDDIVVTSLMAVLAFLASWLVQLIFLATYLRFGNNRAMLTRKVIELHHDSLYEESMFNKSYHYWPGIQKVVRWNGDIAIYTTAYSAQVIPKRAFSNNIERERFWATLNQKVSNGADMQ